MQGDCADGASERLKVHEIEHDFYHIQDAKQAMQELHYQEKSFFVVDFRLDAEKIRSILMGLLESPLETFVCILAPYFRKHFFGEADCLCQFVILPISQTHKSVIFAETQSPIDLKHLLNEKSLYKFEEG